MNYSCSVFESSVVLDGTKTITVCERWHDLFESSVVLDGTKTEITMYKDYR